MSRSRPVVALDGPAGAGKSTVSRLVARRLGYVLVDTGALYRTVALAAQKAGIAWDDAGAVSALAHRLAADGAITLVSDADCGLRVLLGDEDVSDAIRAQKVGQGASQVSAIGGVREALLAMQRDAGSEGGVVLEGRDIGSVVFPDAEAKFFLTASVEVRAKRRVDQLRERGEEADEEEVRREVIERDERDSNRAVAPLARAPDAELVDSSTLDIDEVVSHIVGRVREVERRLAGRDGADG